MESAERIYRELISEEASHWFISDGHGKKIIIKLPSVSIKSISYGAKIQFIFNINELDNNKYLHSGLRVQDDPIHYLDITGIQRFYYDHVALTDILRLDKVFVEFYNEINVCVMTSFLQFSKENKAEMIDYIGDIKQLYVGDLDQNAKRSLDYFDSLLGHGPLQAKNEQDIKIVDVQLYNFINTKSHFLGLNEKCNLELQMKDGDSLENLAWFSLEGIFNKNIFKNPDLVKNTNNKRELTDVFAFYDKGFFIIETKALSVDKVLHEKDMGKKISGIKKQIRKGLKQIIGAARSIRKGYKIFSRDNIEILFNRTFVPQTIILVSELYPLKDWSDIIELILMTMKEENIFINVMDLSELVKLSLPFKGKIELFDYNLIARTKVYIDNKTLHIHGIIKK